MPATPPQPPRRQQQPPQATHQQQRSATGLRPSPSLTSPLAPHMVRQSSWGGSGSGSIGDGEAQALLPPLPPLVNGAGKGGSSSGGGGSGGGNNGGGGGGGRDSPYHHAQPGRVNLVRSSSPTAASSRLKSSPSSSAHTPPQQTHFPQRSRSQTYTPQRVSYRSLEVSPVPDNATDNTDKALVPRNGSSSDRGRNGPTSTTASVEKTTKGDGRTLYLSFISMVAVGIGNRIYGKLETLPMHNYAFFQNALMNFIYVPICFLYILPMLWCGSSITKEQTSVPKLKFAIMGLFDSVAGMMQTFAINYIPSGALIVLLSQASIPISMYISKVSLGATYSRSQYTGAVIVLLGIVVVLLPTFILSSSSKSPSRRPRPPSSMSSPPSSSSSSPSSKSSRTSSPPSSSPPASASRSSLSSSASRPRPPSSMPSPPPSSSSPSSSPPPSSSPSSRRPASSSPRPSPSSPPSTPSSPSSSPSPLPPSSTAPHTTSRSRTRRFHTHRKVSSDAHRHTATTHPHHLHRHADGASYCDMNRARVGGGGGDGAATGTSGRGGGGGDVRDIHKHRASPHAAHTRALLYDGPRWHLHHAGEGGHNRHGTLHVPSFLAGGNNKTTKDVASSVATAILGYIASRMAARGGRGVSTTRSMSSPTGLKGMMGGVTTTTRRARGPIADGQRDIKPITDGQQDIKPITDGQQDRSNRHDGVPYGTPASSLSIGGGSVRGAWGDNGPDVGGRGGDSTARSLEGERDEGFGGGSHGYGDAGGFHEYVRVEGAGVDGRRGEGGAVVRRRLRARSEGGRGKKGSGGSGSADGIGGDGGKKDGAGDDGDDGHDDHNSESSVGNVRNDPAATRGDEKDDGADTKTVGGDDTFKVEGDDTGNKVEGVDTETVQGDGTETGYTYNNNNHDSYDEDTDDQEGGGRAPLLWVGVMILSMVPATLSSVYKEMALGETDIDVIYLNGWVSVFQFLFNLPMVLPSAWITNIRTRDIPQNLWDGARCYWGQDSVLVATESMPADDCRMAFFYTNTYLAFNIVYNVLSIVILKHGSSNILYLASTVMVPINNLAFSLKIVPGHQPVHPTDLLGLVVIMAGLLVYRFFSPLRKWVAVRGVPLSDKQANVVREMEKVSRAVSSRNVAYFGLNQTELLCGPVLDHRVQKAQQERVQRLLARSPSDIRGSFLLRLGIPPTQALEARARRYSGERSPVLPSYKGGPSTTYSPNSAATLVRPAHAARKLGHARSRSLPPSPTEEHLVQPV